MRDSARFISGTDEAGRGCIIGPLVVATVMLDRRAAKHLKSLGARDSKRLSPKKRNDLAPVIKRLSRSFEVTLVPPSLIDSYVMRRQKFNTLNKLEAEVFASHLAELKPRRAYMDSPYANAKMFAKMVRSELPKRMRIRLMAETKADENRIEVSCASILAKVTRDDAIADLRQVFGNFGSGYPSDVRTRNFLRSIPKETEMARHLRWSWRTWNRLK